jgi:CRISPR-associated protein Cmr2
VEIWSFARKMIIVTVNSRMMMGNTYTHSIPLALKNMSQIFWQAKIWGLLHDPVLKALHNNTGRGGNSFWQELAVMQSWVENKWDPENSGKGFFEHIHLADYITSASDRGAVGIATKTLNYDEKGLEIRHLLSGKPIYFKLAQDPHQKLLLPNRGDFLEQLEKLLLPQEIKNEATDIRQVFWWLWRCLPEATCQAFGSDASLLLMPAETRLPDSSIWNHASLTAAMAGALAGYDLMETDINAWKSSLKSHPYLAVFNFTPVQELIKASRKMRDFASGSWILHYLSAKISWVIANKYGPDCLLYPNVFKQPLIDHWLLQKFPHFHLWIKQPEASQLLTAGFPNVLVIILPEDKVAAAMQLAEQTLQEEWLNLSHLSFEDLQAQGWMAKPPADLPPLKETDKTWQGWLKSQWQTYWSAVAIGQKGLALKNSAIEEKRRDDFEPWVNRLNKAYRVVGDRQLFQEKEEAFLRQAYAHRFETQGRRFSVNVGSWWPYIFDTARATLEGVKNNRTWEMPTVFGVRSTISGLGPVVHPGEDWLPEGTVKKLWKQRMGRFDGREQLNATEVIKRSLHKVLPKLLGLEDPDFATYPDLTAGVAGYLKTQTPEHGHYFRSACRDIRKILRKYNPIAAENDPAWGIPRIDITGEFKDCHSRYLSPGWLLEEDDTEASPELKHEIQATLSKVYSQNNPADWYVLAAGDGDGMSEWLKGKHLKAYHEYFASQTSVPNVLSEVFNEFKALPKRMGPSTHSALSRALLDFSNQLVPYLTEQRYAGRLIYSGGDDVLAFTNLWEWDSWLWDIRRCFRGESDPQQEFEPQGNYWHWSNGSVPPPSPLEKRPLFTMGEAATISFGIVIAHHSVPLAIALENLWAAEDEAKKHNYRDAENKHQKKDAVQVRVLYGNGNSLQSTAKFDVFNEWRTLLTAVTNLKPALFEQAAQLWQQHPVPVIAAIEPWVTAFCERRDFFNGEPEQCETFQRKLSCLLGKIWWQSLPQERDQQIQNWLKLAAFVLRKRDIKLPV